MTRQVSAPLYSDYRDLAYTGISKDEATFLRRRWRPNELGYATLSYKGFKLIVSPWNYKEKQVGDMTIYWDAKGQHAKLGKFFERSRSSPEDAKLVCFRKIQTVLAQVKNEEGARKSQKKKR